MSVRPRGPAADPALLPSTHPSNPYEFSPAMFEANSLDPKVTSTHIFFLGAESSDPHCCLTQWYPSPFHGPRLHATTADEESPDYVLFPTAEHYMMYQKAIVMSDHSTAAEILKHPHPSQAKRLGRQVKRFDGAKWKKHAERAVEEANWAKFTQCEDMGLVLLSTGDKILVEASPEDTIWGIGFDSRTAENRESEWGQNLLGKILMRVRDRLRDDKRNKSQTDE